MENTSRIYDALVTLFGQSKQWADVRHLYTLVWMVIGLIHSGSVNLTKWTMYIHGLVNLALACEPVSGELWYIVSNEATTLQTFREYGLRFDIEESFRIG